MSQHHRYLRNSKVPSGSCKKPQGTSWASLEVALGFAGSFAGQYLCEKVIP